MKTLLTLSIVCLFMAACVLSASVYMLGKDCTCTTAETQEQQSSRLNAELMTAIKNVSND